MKKENLKNYLESFKELQKDFDLNQNYIEEIENKIIEKKFETKDEIIDFIDDYVSDNNLTDVNIIYYASAMEFLSENDNSLERAMELASDYWYQTKQLNSELLASLVASGIEREEFWKFIGACKELEIKQN